MKELQTMIVENGIENIRIQFIGESLIRDELDAVCTLEKYWDDDDYTDYVHKIRVVSLKPYINMWGDVMKNDHAYYMCDLESTIRQGRAKILA